MRGTKLVLVSAGPFGSPGILERSGIGAKHVLEHAGVKSHVDLPGVGENYQGCYSVKGQFLSFHFFFLHWRVLVQTTIFSSLGILPQMKRKLWMRSSEMSLERLRVGLSPSL